MNYRELCKKYNLSSLVNTDLMGESLSRAKLAGENLIEASLFYPRL